MRRESLSEWIARKERRRERLDDGEAPGAEQAGRDSCAHERLSASAKWGQFVNATYLPFYQRKWKRSSAMTN